VLTTNQILKAAKLENQLGFHKYPHNQHYTDKEISSISNIKESLSYIDLDGEKRTLSVSDEEIDFIKRESDMPTFYARLLPNGAKLFLIYDSKSGELAREIQLDGPYKRLGSKCYTKKELQSFDKLCDKCNSDSAFNNLKAHYDNLKDIPESK
jgi:hypothetical protein